MAGDSDRDYWRRQDQQRDFWQRHDRDYENFREDQRWERERSERDHADARAAFRRGNTVWALHRLGMTDAAIDMLSSGHSSPTVGDREEALDYYQRGLKQMEAGDFLEASMLFTSAVVRDERGEYYRARGDARAARGMLDLAMEDYEQAAIHGIGWPRAYNAKGIARMNARQYDKAIADFGMAIVHDDQCAYAYYNRGLCIDQLGKPAEAANDFETAARLFRAAGRTSDADDAEKRAGRGHLATLFGSWPPNVR
jgi:tetratricopeptide (TPR) repeat protein